jgi:hypothetical protein
LKTNHKKEEECEQREIDLSKLSKRTRGQLPLWIGYNLSSCVRRCMELLKTKF